MPKRTVLFASCLLALGLTALSPVAMAGEPITVYTDHSRVLSVSRPPATIIIGNPSIADVTIQGNQVLLHARSFGETNIIILDEQGSQLADYEVTVQLGGNNNVAVFKAGYRYSYVCAPDCESTLHVGDEKEYFLKWIVPEQQAKIKIAMGQKSGENVSQDVPDTSSPQQ
jgi:Flp pilus assembly secretin CpaC